MRTITINTKNLISLRINILLLSLIIVSCRSHNEQSIEDLLTKDSIQYFDAIRSYKNHTRPNISYSFSKNGENNQYNFSRYNNERYIVPYFPKKNDYGISNTWRIINDSIIEMLGRYKVVVRKHTNDTIYLIEPGNTKISTILVRIKGVLKLVKIHLREGILSLMSLLS